MLAGLDRHQRVAEHVGSRRADFVLGAREADAALGVGAELLELALAAPAGMNLRLHDIERPGQLLRGFDRPLHAHRGKARGNRNAELREQFLGLIFVDVHEGIAALFRRSGMWPRLKHRRQGESTPCSRRCSTAEL